MARMTEIKRIIRAAVPVGLIELRQSWRRTQTSEVTAFHEERRKRIASVGRTPTGSLFKADQYDRVVSFLVEQGVPELHIREGSVPLHSLEFLNNVALSTLSPKRPSLVLHIGNFVGVSLAYITEKIRSLNHDSIVVAIDPNIPHRTTNDPQSIVLKLLKSTGLEQNVLLITGFSLEQNISSDGTIFEYRDPTLTFASECSCENALHNLGKLFRHQFDVVCLDGNHQADYLEREIEAILPLMASGAWMIMDDVDEFWIEVQDVFKSISRWGLKAVATDGRVGIARFSSNAE